MQGFVFKDEAEAQAACEWWKKKLALSDFIILCRIKRQNDMMPEKNGTGEWVLATRTVLIKLLDPIDYPKDCVVPLDHEVVLVHELLHPKLAYFDDTPENETSTEWTMMETFVEDIARALVNLRRLAYPESPWRD